MDPKFASRNMNHLLQVGDDTGASTRELSGHTDTVSLLSSLK